MRFTKLAIDPDATLPTSVGIAYSDVHREDFPTEQEYITEKDAEMDAARIGDTLASLGVAVQLHPGNAELPERLRRDAPGVVLNLVDSVKGEESLASAIPGVLELLGIPYTGAGILGLSLDTNKFVIKKLLQEHGVPVPYFQLFSTPEDRLDPLLRFPLISKLNAIHGSVEITDDAVSENVKHLRRRLRYLIGTYRQPVLVEEFISGREITAIVLQDRRKRVFLAEKVFNKPKSRYVYLTFADQWLTEGRSVFRYRRCSDSVLKKYVRKAFSVAKMVDYGKFDIRVDHSGRYHFIDSNCNPAFGPVEHDVALSVILDMYGIPFEDILRRLLLNAVGAPPPTVA
ncbi:MAG: hypothetical protein MUF84_02060 [Anaerolineae bacterium]|nr:hypothetical protein [Anaerolineae bacterium]